MLTEVRQKTNIHEQCAAFYVVQNRCNVALCFMLTSVGKGWEGLKTYHEACGSAGMCSNSPTGGLKLIFSSFMFQIDVCINRCNPHKPHTATCCLGLNRHKTMLSCDGAGLARTSSAADQPVSSSHPMSVQLSCGTCLSLCHAIHMFII